MFSLSRFLPSRCILFGLPGSLHIHSIGKEDSPMKYEAPKAVVVDFENDYVAAVGWVPSKTA